MAKLRIPISSEDHVQGPDDALVTLVEYGDYQCPHCARAYPIVKAVQQQFENKLRFVFRNFPLREMHSWAEPAAETAEYAGTRGEFWEMHDLLFENQQSLDERLLLDLAKRLGLDVSGLRKSLKEHRFADRIQKEFSGGVRSGVNGTPTFFINGERHNGDSEFATLVHAIDLSMSIRK